VHCGVGKTGVVGVIRGGQNAARSIGLRADMDALPMDEASDLPFKSRNPGVFHGCGHDGHTTMLLGAARYLAQTRKFGGTVVLIFQPAEEGLGGAKAMIDDGLFQRFPCDEIYGLHNSPAGPAGAGLRSGAGSPWRAPGSSTSTSSAVARMAPIPIFQRPDDHCGHACTGAAVDRQPERQPSEGCSGVDHKAPRRHRLQCDSCDCASRRHHPLFDDAVWELIESA